MFKDKIVRESLLGKSGKWFGVKNSRTNTITIPTNGVEPERSITFMADDGFIVYLIRRIEKGEQTIKTLEKRINGQDSRISKFDNKIEKQHKEYLNSNSSCFDKLGKLAKSLKLEYTKEDCGKYIKIKK